MHVYKICVEIVLMLQYIATEITHSYDVGKWSVLHIDDWPTLLYI